MHEVPAGLVGDLQRAAELEHAVLLQYLFAAASLKRRTDEGASVLQLERIRGWERTLLAIAREEMAHLAAVSNLLLAVGSVPWLVRPGLPGGRLAGGDVLVLERFGRRSVGRFVGLEREESATIAGHYAAIRQEIARIEAAGGRVVRVIPDDLVDGWRIGGAAHFPRITDAASAIAVVDAIVAQGAGQREAGPRSHLQRLLAIEAELAGEEPDFDPARRVLSGPPIGDRFTAAVAAAFACTYQVMLLLLELYYRLLPVDPLGAVGARRVVVGLMSGVLRPLAEVLCELPLGDAAPGWACGPAFAWDREFGLSDEAGVSRRLLAARLAGAGASLGELSRHAGRGRLGRIGENLLLAGRLVAA